METATANADPQPAQPATPEWSKVVEAYKQVHHNPDLQALRALYSAAAAHYLPGLSVWIFLIGPPSSGKTDMLIPLEQAKAIVISTVTPQTFISGWTWRKPGGKKNRDASLLTRIGSGIIVCKDFSQVLSMPKKQKGPVLADLRDIYDGRLVKEFGTGERKDWSGRITFLAGVTQDLDQHYSIFQSLGERFVQVRERRPGGVEAALKAMQRHDAASVSALLASATEELFRPIISAAGSRGGLKNPSVSEAQLNRIANLAEFAVHARTHVHRDGRSREIVYMPEAEASPRLAQQLAQLARGSALLEGRQHVNAKDLALAERVAFDSIRADRRAILDFLRGQNGAVTITKISQHTRLSQTMVSRRIEELHGLGLVVWEPSLDGADGTSVRLSKHARKWLKRATARRPRKSARG